MTTLSACKITIFSRMLFSPYTLTDATHRRPPSSQAVASVQPRRCLRPAKALPSSSQGIAASARGRADEFPPTGGSYGLRFIALMSCLAGASTRYDSVIFCRALLYVKLSSALGPCRYRRVMSGNLTKHTDRAQAMAILT